MCFEFDFSVVSDGGAVDPGAGNRGYGSYQLSKWASSATTSQPCSA
jgi:hypothetical protein